MNPHHIDPCRYHPCAQVPEPSTLAMICIAEAVMALFAWLKRRRA